MNPRFSQIGPSCEFCASGSGQVWLRNLTTNEDTRIDLYGGWGPQWIDNDRVLYNGGNINDHPGHPERTGTWQYTISTGARVRLSTDAYSEAAAGNGQWMSTISGQSIRFPDGTTASGRYFAPVMNKNGEFGYMFQTGGPDGPMTLYWKGVAIRTGNLRTPVACNSGVAWIEGFDAWGDFGSGAQFLSCPVTGSNHHLCVPFLVGTELWLLQSRTWSHFTHNENELILRPYNSSMGYYVLDQPIPTFEPDAEATETTIYVSYAKDGLQIRTLDITAPRIDLGGISLPGTTVIRRKPDEKLGKQPGFADLKTTLAQSRQIDNPLYQTIQEMIERLMQFQKITVARVEQVNDKIEGGYKNFAYNSATYHTKGNEIFYLPNSVQLLAGLGIEFDDSVANKRVINSVGGAGNYYDSPLTDGDMYETDFIFANGECIIVQVPNI